MGSAALIYLTVSMSHEIVASNVSAADILKWHVEKAVRGIPDRVYAVDRRVVRCVALPPWDLWDVKQGGSHVDPLAMDVYSIRLYSRNLESGSNEERLYAQSIVKNIPEGAMLPEGFAAYFTNMPGRQPAANANYRPTPKDVMDLYNNKLMPGDKARIMLGLKPKGAE